MEVKLANGGLLELPNAVSKALPDLACVCLSAFSNTQPPNSPLRVFPRLSGEFSLITQASTQTLLADNTDFLPS